MCVTIIVDCVTLDLECIQTNVKAEMFKFEVLENKK